MEGTCPLKFQRASKLKSMKGFHTNQNHSREFAAHQTIFHSLWIQNIKENSPPWRRYSMNLWNMRWKERRNQLKQSLGVVNLRRFGKIWEKRDFQDICDLWSVVSPSVGMDTSLAGLKPSLSRFLKEGAAVAFMQQLRKISGITLFGKKELLTLLVNVLLRIQQIIGSQF